MKIFSKGWAAFFTMVSIVVASSAFSEQLQDAARVGNLDGIKRLIASGSSVG